MSYHSTVCRLSELFVLINKRLCDVLVVGLLMFSSVSLNNVAYALTISDRDFYQTGLAFYQAGQLEDAANNWQSLAQNSQAEDYDSKKQAAFAAVLATLSWEQLQNANAYQTWADAIRLYLEANTTWEQQRLILKERVTGNRMALQQLTSNMVIVEAFEQLLLDMDANYALTDYQGPRTGLQKSEANRQLDVTQYIMASPLEAKANTEPETESTATNLVEQQSQSSPNSKAEADNYSSIESEKINNDTAPVEANASEPADTVTTSEPASLTQQPEVTEDRPPQQTTPSLPSSVESNETVSPPSFSRHIIPITPEATNE